MAIKQIAKFAFFCLLLLTSWAPINADQPADEWTLPVGEGAFIDSSFASSDGRWVVCTSVVTKDNKGVWSIWLLDTQSGKSVNLADAINADLKDMKVGFTKAVIFSGDGKYAAIVFENYGAKGKNFLYLTSLDTQKTKKVLESDGKIFASWGGGLLYASQMGESIGNLYIIDPAKEEPEVKKATFCMVCAADPKGQFLVVCCDKDDPGKADSPKDKDSLAIAIISPNDGKLIRALLPLVETGSQPIISPNGKFIAFIAKPKTAPADERKTRIYFTEDQVKWDQIDTPGSPLAILDDMRVVTLEKDNNKNQTAKIAVIRGEQTVLAEKVQTAAVGGERLFVTFQDSGGKIKAISLKK